LLAKEIAAAEKMGGARQAVMLVDQEVAEGGNQLGEAMGVLILVETKLMEEEGYDGGLL